MDKFCGSDFWVTNYTWMTDSPRFTSCFEETVLVWIPCGFLWLISLFEIWRSFRSTFRFIPWNWFNTSKMIACTILIILTLLDFLYALYWHPPEKIIYPVDYSSSIVKHLTFILAGYIILVHRKHGVRTSALMFIFWFLLFICGLPHFLSQINSSVIRNNRRLDYIYASNLIYYSVVIFMFVMSIFVDASPYYSLYPTVQKPCPDASSSFLTNWLTLWFDSFALKTYRSGSIDIEQLWNVNYENSLEYLVPKFERFWNIYSRKKNGKNLFRCCKSQLNGVNVQGRKYYESLNEDTTVRVSILPILWRCFRITYLTASVFKLCADLLVFVTPLLLNLLINFGENREPTWHGYVYAILLPSIGLFQALFMDWYVFRSLDLGIRMRSTLMSVIYKKALRMSNAARSSFTIGEVTNLMSVDAQRFSDIQLYFNMAVAAFYQIGLASVFLWSFLGPSMLAGVAVMIILVPLNGCAAIKAKSYQLEQMKCKDERIKVVNEVLCGIKTLKMYAWEESFEEKIMKIRNQEINYLKRTAYLNTGVSFFWGCTSFLVSLVSFAVFTLSSPKNVLNAQTAFVSLALFNIIRLPISLLPRIFPNVIQTYVAVKRINRYLNTEELDNDDVSRSALERWVIGDSCVIKNGFFNWDKKTVESPILKNINLNIPRGSLTAVVGTVGSGKSSLVSALLGEMNKIRGYVNIKGSVAYVPQQAWLLNATLRDNITFASEYQKGKYDKILEACALKPDLKMLPGADLTEIGERGINLSGGQKQRISLARAVYHDADVYLLDDPLSAVDVHVGKHIFENVIGPNGLLSRRTRLFVTHAISFLPEVDFIVVIKNGAVSESGTYNELISKGGSFSEFLTNNSSSEINETINEDEQQYKINRTLSEENGKIVSQVGENASMGISVANQKLTEDEIIESGNVRKETYLYYFKCGNMKLWLFALLFEVIFEGFLVASNFTLSAWSSDPSAVLDGVQNEEIRNFYLGEYFAFGIGQFLFIFLTTLFIYVAALNGSLYLHTSVLHKVLRWPSYLFDVTPIGRILSRLSFDMDVIDNVLPFTLLEIFNLTGVIFSIFFVIIYASPYFIVAAIPLSILYIILERVYVSTMRQLKRLESTSRSPIYSHFGETISGAPVIRAYGVQNKFVSESENRINVNQIYTYASIFAGRWVGNRMNILANMIVFLTALLAVVGRDTISSGIIGLCVTYVLQISNVLYWFVKMATDLETNIVSVERLRQFENTVQEESVNLKCLSKFLSKSWPERGEVIFKDFKVRYRTGLEPVLRGITFEITAGEKVGIVGRTGAGKSSLTLSLFNLIEPIGGSIIIDGIDISTIDLRTLRSRLTIIPQDPVIFSGSLRFNLDPFFEYTDAKIYYALELAHLKSYVSSLPDKLQHVLSENGGNLSVGQRQLLCLARALLRKTKILILDEATAAVDLETDDLIQRTIRSEFKDCTVLTIAHRLNTIIDSDKVIVLDKGLIVEYDKPGVLLNSKTSVFYQMAKDAGVISY